MRLIIACFCTVVVFLAPVHAQTPDRRSDQTANLVNSAPVIVGPLSMSVTPSSDGMRADIEISLQSILVGVAVLHPQYPQYAFDVEVGTSSAKGQLTALFLPANQLSTVMADVTISVQGQSDQTFRGLVHSWVMSGQADVR